MKLVISMLLSATMVLGGLLGGHAFTSIATCQWAADHTIILDSQSDQQKLLIIVAKDMVVQKCLEDIFLEDPIERILTALGNTGIANEVRQ